MNYSSLMHCGLTKIFNLMNYIIILLCLAISSCNHKYSKLYNQKPAFYSYIIGDSVNIEKELYSEVYATPTSCNKVVTAIAALSKLTHNHTFKTYAFKNGNNIIIKFTGDPNLKSEDIKNLLQPLKNHNINKLILDLSEFKVPYYSTNNMIDDMGSSYAGPVSSANIDHNLVKINYNITSKKIFFTNDSGYTIKSQVTTLENATKVNLKWHNNTIYIAGNINKNDEDLPLKISPINHELFLRKKLSTIAKELGMNKPVVISYNNISIPKKYFIFESKPLSETLKPAMKVSDNLFFDSLYLTIVSQKLGDEFTDWSQGSEVIKNIIREHHGIDMAESLIVDGSGLSRYNRIKPKILYAILDKSKNNHYFLNALPKALEPNSTLEKRETLKENILAKTGSVLGISCLCGYDNNKTFVIMTNSFSPPAKNMHKVIDGLINN